MIFHCRPKQRKVIAVLRGYQILCWVPETVVTYISLKLLFQYAAFSMISLLSFTSFIAVYSLEVKLIIAYDV